MGRLPYMLLLRGTTYYYRRVIEKPLRPLLGGKAQVWKSLRTSALDVAKLRSLEEVQCVERMLQELRRRASSAQTNSDSLARLYQSTALLMTRPGAAEGWSRMTTTPWCDLMRRSRRRKRGHSAENSKRRGTKKTRQAMPYGCDLPRHGLRLKPWGN
jgi:uncharacterized protein DUF6538